MNPGSVILSGEMMFRHLGWTEAADLIVKGMDGAISTKRVTYDFARLMDGATELSTSAFGDADHQEHVINAVYHEDTKNTKHSLEDPSCIFVVFVAS